MHATTINEEKAMTLKESNKEKGNYQLEGRRRGLREKAQNSFEKYHNETQLVHNSTKHILKINKTTV